MPKRTSNGEAARQKLDDPSLGSYMSDGVVRTVMCSPGRVKMLRISAGSAPVLPNTVRHLGVELGDLAGSEDPVAVAEDESQVAGQDVDPLVAVVGPRFGVGLARRDDDLPGLHAVGLSGERDDGPALDAAGSEADPRIAHLGRTDEVVQR